MFLNNTHGSNFDDCARYFYWSRETPILGGPGGLTTKWIDDNLAWGQIVHVSLAELYAERGPAESFELGREYCLTEPQINFEGMSFDEKNKWLDHLEWIERIIYAYDKYRADADDFSIIQLESEGCVVLGEVCYVCGEPYPVLDGPEQIDFHRCTKCRAEVHHWVFRIDMEVNRNGRSYIVDHKTTRSASDTYLASWHTSHQLLGYSYGVKKYSGRDIRGYGVNIIRKLKSIGSDKSDTRVCPDCRNGSRKKLTCEPCGYSGRVKRDTQPSDSPFQREWEGYSDADGERFVLHRLSTIERIKSERERFKTEPEIAWPMNHKRCYAYNRPCAFIKLCHRTSTDWHNPPIELLDNLQPNPVDYVNAKAMAKEEME